MPDQAETHGFVDTISRYIERSGNWPLSIALSIWGPFGPHGIEFSSFTHLTRHAQRWRTFKYRGDTPLDVLSESQFPSLVELDLGWMNSSELDRFIDSPRLSALSTHIIPTSKVICNQLIHLDFTMKLEPSIELAETLHSCPSVKSLTLGLRYKEFKYSSAQGTWPNITSLVVKENFLKT
jgi:hypothetical protein